jgi:LacI family transcriptional regulator
MDEIPTLDDIARLSGFSKSTVSLALRHHPRIPEPTRRAIETVAAKINYRPDPALARVAANRWRRVPTQSTVAFVTTNHPGGGISDQLSIAGARLRAETFGYHIELFRFEDYGSARRLGEVIYSRGIKGVIIGKLFRNDLAATFPWQHFAAVACDTGFFRPPVRMVMPDHAHAVHRAWQEAAARGYRRIGMVLFKEYTAVDYFDKVSAFLFNQHTLPARERLEVGHIDPLDHGAFRDWFAAEKPDVILGFNPAVYHWLLELGCRVPQDYGFIALMGANSPDTYVTRLEENMELLGQIALEQLDILLRTNQYGLPKIVSTQQTESTWVPGTTLRNQPAAKGRKNLSAPAAGKA